MANPIAPATGPKLSTIVWSSPLPLKDYRQCAKGPGIYAIGRVRDPDQPVVSGTEFDAYMFNWPDNLAPLYVGISESRGEGLRRRLRTHYRGRGNKQIARLVAQGEALWFVACSGSAVVNFEALFLVAFTPETGFIANRRSETTNFGKRMSRVIDDSLRSQGIDPSSLLVPGDEDYFRDG